MSRQTTNCASGTKQPSTPCRRKFDPRKNCELQCESRVLLAISNPASRQISPGALKLVLSLPPTLFGSLFQTQPPPLQQLFANPCTTDHHRPRASTTRASNQAPNSEHRTSKTLFCQVLLHTLRILAKSKAGSVWAQTRATPSILEPETVKQVLFHDASGARTNPFKPTASAFGTST